MTAAAEAAAGTETADAGIEAEIAIDAAIPVIAIVTAGN
jgi:hypothetical protein